MDKYTYRITYSKDGNEYIGFCAEFPSLSWLDKSQNKAFKGIQKLVKDVLIDMEQTGETPPQPLATKQYSGKFMVRIPPTVHRDLAIQANENNISLNRLVSSRLIKNN